MKAVDRFQPGAAALLDLRDLVDPPGGGRGVASYGRTIRLPRARGRSRSARWSASGGVPSRRKGREPSEEELGARVGMPVEKLRLLLDAARAPFSLDAPTAERGAGNRHHDPHHTASYLPEDEVISQRIPSRNRGCLEPLTEREREVDALRYGFAADRVSASPENRSKLGLSRTHPTDRERARSRSFGASGRPEHSYCSSASQPYSPGTGIILPGNAELSAVV